MTVKELESKIQKFDEVLKADAKVMTRNDEYFW